MEHRTEAAASASPQQNIRSNERARALLMLAAPLAKYVGLVPAVATATEIIAVICADTNISIDRAARLVLLGQLLNAVREETAAWRGFVAGGGDVNAVISALHEPWQKILDEQLLARRS